MSGFSISPRIDDTSGDVDGGLLGDRWTKNSGACIGPRGLCGAQLPVPRVNEDLSPVRSPGDESRLVGPLVLCGAALTAQSIRRQADGRTALVVSRPLKELWRSRSDSVLPGGSKEQRVYDVLRLHSGGVFTKLFTPCNGWALKRR